MIDTLKPLIKQFLPFAQEKMGFERPPRLFLKQDSPKMRPILLGKTGILRSASAMSITLFITERHPKRRYAVFVPRIGPSHSELQRGVRKCRKYGRRRVCPEQPTHENHGNSCISSINSVQRLGRQHKRNYL